MNYFFLTIFLCALSLFGCLWYFAERSEKRNAVRALMAHALTESRVFMAKHDFKYRIESQSISYKFNPHLEAHWEIYVERDDPFFHLLLKANEKFAFYEFWQNSDPDKMLHESTLWSFSGPLAYLNAEAGRLALSALKSWLDSDRAPHDQFYDAPTGLWLVPGNYHISPRPDLQRMEKLSNELRYPL